MKQRFALQTSNLGADRRSQAGVEQAIRDILSRGFPIRSLNLEVGFIPQAEVATRISSLFTTTGPLVTTRGNASSRTRTRGMHAQAPRN